MENVKGFIIICIAIGLLFSLFKLLNGKRKYLLQNGISAYAKVISIDQTLAAPGNGPNPRYVMEIVLEIEVTGSFKEVTIHQALYSWETPEAGDMVAVLVDPVDPKNVILSPDQRSMR